MIPQFYYLVRLDSNLLMTLEKIVSCMLHHDYLKSEYQRRMNVNKEEKY